jgi:hypothetical protein
MLESSGSTKWCVLVNYVMLRSSLTSNSLTDMPPVFLLPLLILRLRVLGQPQTVTHLMPCMAIPGCLVL